MLSNVSTVWFWCIRSNWVPRGFVSKFQYLLWRLSVTPFQASLLVSRYTTMLRTHLRQPPSPPGFAKLFPSRGKAGFYFGFITTFRVCPLCKVRLMGRSQSVSRHQIPAKCHSASMSIGSPSSRTTRLLSNVLRQSTVALFTTTGLYEENSESPNDLR